MLFRSPLRLKRRQLKKLRAVVVARCKCVGHGRKVVAFFFLEKDMQSDVKAAIRAEREKVAQWMISHGFATGHGDTMEDLLHELAWQICERKQVELDL